MAKPNQTEFDRFIIRFLKNTSYRGIFSITAIVLAVVGGIISGLIGGEVAFLIALGGTFVGGILGMMVRKLAANYAEFKGLPITDKAIHLMSVSQQQRSPGDKLGLPTKTQSLALPPEGRPDEPSDPKEEFEARAQEAAGFSS